jgi:hypothetical protein
VHERIGVVSEGDGADKLWIERKKTKEAVGLNRAVEKSRKDTNNGVAVAF